MSQSGPPSTSSLIRPLGAHGVLIRGEKIVYNERRHWAKLIMPFLETLAILTLITAIAGGTVNAFGVFMIVIVAVGGVLRWRKLKSIQRYQLYGVLALIVLGLIAFSVPTVAILVIIGATGRFVYQAVMWAFYERLYITNRRVIGASGFLGARISTMPLTRVTDIAYKRSIPGEILGYGVLRLESAGQDQALGLLTFLERPSEFYEYLIDLSTAAVGLDKKDLSEVLRTKDANDGSGTLLPESGEAT